MHILPIHSVVNQSNLNRKIPSKYSNDNIQNANNTKSTALNPNFKVLSEPVKQQLLPYLDGSIRYTEKGAKKFSTLMQDNESMLYFQKRYFGSLEEMFSENMGFSFNKKSKNAKLYLNHFILGLMDIECMNFYRLGDILCDNNFELYKLTSQCFFQENEKQNIKYWFKDLKRAYNKYFQLHEYNIFRLYHDAAETKNFTMLDLLNRVFEPEEKRKILHDDYNNHLYNYRNMTPQDEYEELIQNKDLYNVEYFVKFFTNKYVQEKQVEIFEKNSDIIMAIPDIVKTEKNAEKYDNMLNALKSLRSLNFDIVDENNISFLEKVLNSENLDLLNVVKDNKFTYHQELDWAYNNIVNKDLKKEAANLKIYFKNVYKAIQLLSIDGLDSLESQIKSPFFNNKENLKELARKLAKVSPDFREYFLTIYKDQIPEYVKPMANLYSTQN